LWNILDILDGSQSEAEVKRALDQLNPKVFAEVYSLALSRLQDVQKTVSDRLTLLGSAMTAAGGAGGSEVLSLATGQGSAWTAWTNAYGSWSAREANPTLGEGGSSRSSAGNVTGVEHRFGTLTLGWLGALGTGSTQINNPESSITSESWHLGLYMSTPVTERIFADGSFIFGEGENVLKRTQTLKRTDESGTDSPLSLASRTRMMNQEWLVQLGVGAQVAPAGGPWSIVPTVRVAYAGVRQQSARESGAMSLGIESESSRNGTVLTRTGLDIAREGRLGPVPVRATGSAAWVHDFAADPRRLGVKWQGVEAVPWLISSERRSVDVLRLGFSLEFGLGDRRTLRLYGEQEYLQNTKVLRGGVNFTIGF
jgi:outer membrane autotransporter protein